MWLATYEGLAYLALWLLTVVEVLHAPAVVRLARPLGAHHQVEPLQLLLQPVRVLELRIWGHRSGSGVRNQGAGAREQGQGSRGQMVKEQWVLGQVVRCQGIRCQGVRRSEAVLSVLHSTISVSSYIEP